MGGKYKSPYTFQEIDDLLATAANVKAAVTEARSWSSGDTGTRPGEEADNAKYWASVARENAGGNYATLTEAEGLAAAAKSEAIAASANKELSNLTDYQKALCNIGGRPNKNLAENWYFAGGGSQLGYGVFPINQRGKTLYSEMQQNMFDRWWHTADVGTFELTSDGLKITSQADVNACMGQFFDTYVAEKTTVTLSALYRGQIILDFYGYTHTPSPVVNDGWGMHSYTYTIPAGTNLADKLYCPTVKAAAGTTAYILAVKFEIGDKQTLAYQDSNGIWRLFETPHYGETLAQCQRQLLKLGANSALGYAESSTTANIFVPVPTSMRAKPVWSGTITKLYPEDGNAVDFVTVSSLDMSSNMICLVCAGTGFTAGKAYSAAYVDGFLSAEL